MKINNLIIFIFIFFTLEKASGQIKNSTLGLTNPDSNLYTTLINRLDSIYKNDQFYRQKRRVIEKEYGRESIEIDNLWKKIHEIDSLNLIEVKEIIKEFGWLEADAIGEQGNKAIFLVIQHADIQTQNYYLPIIREAYQLGNLTSEHLALFEDRVAIRNGECQIYGTQIGRNSKTGEYYVLPLINPEKVNIRRSKLGLNTLEDYVSFYDIEWDLDDFIKNTDKCN